MPKTSAHHCTYIGKWRRVLTHVPKDIPGPACQKILLSLPIPTMYSRVTSLEQLSKQGHFSMLKISRIFTKQISLKNAKMYHILITLIFIVLFFLKMLPNFDVRYQIKPDCQNIFKVVFIDLWPCLLTTKLSYPQQIK